MLYFREVRLFRKIIYCIFLGKIVVMIISDKVTEQYINLNIISIVNLISDSINRHIYFYAHIHRERDRAQSHTHSSCIIQYNNSQVKIKTRVGHLM